MKCRIHCFLWSSILITHPRLIRMRLPFSVISINLFIFLFFKLVLQK
nr:MAG TPA: hypothetical protein [Caudoviricetes sp.]